LKTVIVILIDQLKWDDHIYFPNITRILGSPQKYDVPYFPTITETAHASISTNHYQYYHGVVGSESFNIVENPSIIVEKKVINEDWCKSFEVDKKNIQIHKFNNSGIQTFVLSAKDKVAKLIDPEDQREGRTCRIFCRQPENFQNLEYFIDGNDLVMKNWPALKNNLPKLETLEDERIDQAFLDIAKEMLSDKFRDPAKDAVFFLSLSYTDTSGHKFGHNNQHFIKGLKRLDKSIGDFISNCKRDETSDPIFWVISDHGCREIKHYIWPSEDEKRINVAENGIVNKVIDIPVDYLYEFEYEFDKKPTITFDGGMMRLWVRKEALKKMADFLKEKLSPYIDEIVFFKLDKISRYFNHRNFGNITVLAKKDVAFCKRAWVLKNNIFNYPLGEHGSQFDEDRIVPFWGKFSQRRMVFDLALSFLKGVSS
jgi:predicted AlkP superfamily pyrophosphatase or phosphodiesterase